MNNEQCIMEEDENLFELNDADELYGDDPLGRKTFAFSIRIVRMFKYLRKNHNEYDLSRQVLRSGTGIGSNLQEGGSAQSRPDFISKFHISLKEASETRYWIELLHATDYISTAARNSMVAELIEILKMLTASIVTAKRNSNISTK